MLEWLKTGRNSGVGCFSRFLVSRPPHLAPWIPSGPSFAPYSPSPASLPVLIALSPPSARGVRSGHGSPAVASSRKTTACAYRPPPQVCRLLLEAGADADARDQAGSTALDLAESRGRRAISAVLQAWQPIGLTVTQTQRIKHSREAGPMR